MSDTRADDLAAYVGTAEIADELRLCGGHRGWTPRVPARRWRAVDGYTEAALVTLIVESEQRAEKLVLKSVPHRQTASDPLGEPDAYTKAEQDCPPAFRPHLVLARMPPWSTRSGGTLLFQELAADDVTGCRSLAELPPKDLLEACRLVVDGLLRLWNEEAPTPLRMKISEFLRVEIGPELSSGGSIRSWGEAGDLPIAGAPWIVLPGDSTVYPNPLALARGGSPLADSSMDVLIGRRHGDLHLLNVLVPQASGSAARLGGFQIIDLDGYSSRGPLTSDPVFVLFSALARGMPALPPERWAGLLDFFTRPAEPRPSGFLFDLTATIFDTTSTAIMGRGWTGDWRLQFRLSSLALGIYFTTFTRLSPKVRWWFFRLAARLGRDLLLELGVPVADQGLAVANPFSTPEAGRSRQAANEADSSARPAVRDRPGAVPVDRLVARAWRCSPADRSVAITLLEAGHEEVERIGRSGDPDAVATARDRLADLLDDTTQILGRDDPTTLGFLHRLAYWTHQSGNAVAAVLLYQQVTNLRSKALGEFHPDTVKSRQHSRSPGLLDEAARQRYR